MGYIRRVSGNVYSYDGRIFDYDWKRVKSPYVEMLTTSKQRAAFYKAIHVEQSSKSPIFEPHSAQVDKLFKFDNLIDYSGYYDYLIEEDHPLLVMAGEFDLRDGPGG